MEPCDHGMEHEADVRPGRGEVSQIMPLFASICCVCEKRSVVGATTEVSSANATIRTRIRGCDAGPQNLPPPNIPNLNRVHFETVRFSLAGARAVPICLSSLEQGFSDRCYGLTMG